jgi:hypothetical protein
MIARLHREQAGLVGKFIVGWLLIVAVFGIGAIDGVSIAFTTFRLSDVAAGAASEAASRYEGTGDDRLACDDAARWIDGQDPDVTLTRCRVDRSGVVTVTVRKTATTLVVGRLEFLAKYGRVVRTESVGRP